MDISKDGGSKNPDRDQRVESIIFVVEGSLLLTLEGSKHQLNEGSYVFIPPETKWEITNLEQSNAKFHWVRKIFEKEINLATPEFFIINENVFSNDDCIIILRVMLNKSKRLQKISSN